jgi:hypothetical protein
MNDSILKQLSEKNGNSQSRDNLIDEPPEDLGAFGWLRGSRERAVMLELRGKDGSITALGYPTLFSTPFDLSERIRGFLRRKRHCIVAPLPENGFTSWVKDKSGCSNQLSIVPSRFARKISG